MGPTRIEKDVGKRKERVDRREQTKDKFDPVRLEIKYPGTAILLLKCQEKPVLLAAAAALAKYGSKAKGNLEVLFDLDIVDSVIPLITHEDLFTRRFAAKLLAEMVTIPNVLHFLLDSDYYIPHFAKVLINDNDLFMQEFSSLILAEISKDMFGAAKILKQCQNMDFLFERIQSPDPDVKKNNIEIIYNLLEDPTGATAIINTKNLNLSAVYQLYNSVYPEIQKLALNVIANLVSRNQDEYLQDLFRRSNGLQALLKFLDNVEWEDVHSEAFRILRLAADNPVTAETFDDIGGIKQMLGYLEDTSHSKLFVEALDVAVCLSHTPRGRQALYRYGIVDYLLRTLVGNVQPDIYEISCHSIGTMSLYDKAAKDLTESGCTKNILDIMKNENFKWSPRHAALFALNQLLKCDVKNCENFLNAQGQNYFLRLIRQPIGKIPVEILVGIIECLTTIARNEILRSAIINADTIDAMCASFELTCTSMNEFKIACCNALSVFCIDNAGRVAFLKVNGPNRLYNMLSDVKSTAIRNSAAQLVQLLCADPVLADAFVSARYLNYMLSNRLIARLVPSWDTCIEALFNSHLPIKFAFTGRLSLHDITRDGFYVLRRNVCKFPTLDEIFHFKFCPLEPIYVVNCIRPRKSVIEEKIEENLSSVVQGKISFFHILSVQIRLWEKYFCSDSSDSSSMRNVSRQEILLSNEIGKLRMDTKFAHLQCDPCLNDYLELFKCKLIAAESKDVALKSEEGLVNISYVASRVKMLAKFVAQQLSGPDPLIRCIEHQLEIHLREIMNSIETSVIPLGMLRVGSFLERALLFKVMADRIHLPAALVRGEYGRAWIEVAVAVAAEKTKSTIEEDSYKSNLQKGTSCSEMITLQDSVLQSINEEKDSESIDSISMEQWFTIYPKKLLKPNFIVDLMIKPGDLIPIESRKGKLYREKQLVCDTVCYDQ
nr:armadillo repeat-containing protein 3 isoform X1 [Osmia lignaria]